MTSLRNPNQVVPQALSNLFPVDPKRVPAYAPDLVNPLRPVDPRSGYLDQLARAQDQLLSTIPAYNQQRLLGQQLARSGVAPDPAMLQQMQDLSKQIEADPKMQAFRNQAQQIQQASLANNYRDQILGGIGAFSPIMGNMGMGLGGFGGYGNVGGFGSFGGFGGYGQPMGGFGGYGQPMGGFGGFGGYGQPMGGFGGFGGYGQPMGGFGGFGGYGQSMGGFGGFGGYGQPRGGFGGFGGYGQQPQQAFQQPQQAVGQAFQQSQQPQQAVGQAFQQSQQPQQAFQQSQQPQQTTSAPARAVPSGGVL